MAIRSFRIPIIFALALIALAISIPLYNRMRPDNPLRRSQSSERHPMTVNSSVNASSPKSRDNRAPAPNRTPRQMEWNAENSFPPISRLMDEIGGEPLRYDQPNEAAEFYRLKRLPEGETQIPVERYFEARERMRLMPRYSTARGRMLPSQAELKHESEEAALGEWTPLGPGNVGGRTRALLINPVDPNVMYAAGVAGGVWKTVNGGASWAPLSDMLPNIAVNSMAMDPKNPNVIYAGTGEGFFNFDAIRGAGIFKTSDGGAMWARLDNTIGADFYYVNDIVVSPINSQRVYAATRTGVWRSLDGGVTWARALDPQLNAGCLDLAIRTDQATDYIFASCGSFQQAVVYRNTDAAGSGVWTEVLKDPGMGRTSIAISPSNQNVVYAAAASIVNGPYRDGLHAIFRSTSGGDAGSWTAQTRNNGANKLNTVLFSNPLVAFLGECGLAPSAFSNQGWYDNVIAVDPIDPNRVWVGGIDLFRSDDAGVNWGLASYWWADKNSPRYAHADQHAITFHPQYNGSTNRRMFVANDGGVFRTDDALAFVATSSNAACNPNASGVAWTSLNNGYAVTQFYHGAVFPDGKSYFGGTQDNGTLIGSDGAGANGWREIFGGDGGYVAVDPNDPNTIFLETTRLSLRKSTDGGKTFGAARFGINEPSSSFLFIAPFVIDPSDSRRLWLGGNALWRTTNGGANWSQASHYFGAGGISGGAVSTTDANYVLAGTASGSIFRSDQSLTADGNTVWDSALPRGGFVSWVTFDPANHNVAYATYSTFGGSHVWRSVDAGASWTSIDGTGAGALPDVPVHCIVVNPNNTSNLYIGTDLGVFVSQNGGASWSTENSGFPNTVVESLAINTVDGQNSLYAFTHGRGVWRVALGPSGCGYSLSAPGQSFGVDGGAGSINVTATPGGCGWTASANSDWIAIVAGANGVGPVQFTVASNHGVAARAGTLTIAGRSFTVTQPGRADTTLPNIQVTSPAANGRFNTTSATVTISGVASDDQAVVRITGANERAFDVAVNGLDNWTTPTLPLQIGVNIFTFTAYDASGNSSSATIQINYSPSQSGTGSPAILTAAGTDTFFTRGGYAGDGGPANAARLNYPRGLIFDSSGNLYFSDANNSRVRKIDTAGIINTVAGNGESDTGGDGGPASAAKLNSPNGLALDRAGNLYIAQVGRIRKVAPNGVISTFVELPDHFRPGAMAIDRNDNLYLVDHGNERIQKISPDKTISVIAGTGQGGYSGDGGPATQAQILVTYSGGIDVDAAGNIYIADFANHRIRKIGTDNIIHTIAGNGNPSYNGDNIPAAQATLFFPEGVSVDGAGNVYIAEARGCRIRKIGTDGIITTVAGNGTSGFSGDGGPATSAQLWDPSRAIVDQAGNIYIADSGNHRIRRTIPIIGNDTIPPVVKITSPTTTGSYYSASRAIRLIGTSSDNVQVTHLTWRNNRGGGGGVRGTNDWTTQLNPFEPAVTDIALASGDNIITVTAWDIAGNSSSTTLVVTYTPPDALATFFGKGLAAHLNSPETIAFDPAGNLYVTDTGNHQIRKIARDGVATTFAGTGQIGSRGDGGQAVNAELNSPGGIVLDNSGNAYIADTNNHRVRRIAPNGVITTIAGTGVGDFGGDGGPAVEAKLDTPTGLALDNAGNLFIADAGNNRIRKVDLRAGIISTAAGKGYGDNGNGVNASEALLYFPTSVAFDRAGNLFIADTGNHRVRKVSPSGIMSTFAGDGTAGFKGDGGAAITAQMNAPGGLAFDAAGNLYIADQLNHRVRRISPDGIMNSVAGNGAPGSSGAGDAAASAQLNTPAGVAVDGAGNLFIADTGNHRVVTVTAFSKAATVSAASFSASGAATEAIMAAFGVNLATGTQVATTLPLPTTLAGARVNVRDSLGNERLAPLFFASPSQINYQIPPGAAAGPATITIINGSGVISTGGLSLSSVAPGLFSANADGQGVAAAVVLKIKADGSQVYEPVEVFDQSQNKFVSRPIDLGPATDQVFLILFGTGLRNRSSLSTVTAQIGGESAEVLFVGAQGGFVGLDQVNLRLPRSLAGRGEVEIALTVDGKTANSVRVNVK